jgi:protein phosphatase 2C
VDCFSRVDAEVGGNAATQGKPVAPDTVGSTAVVALVCSSHVIVANCGDSRAVLCRGKQPLALSVDHKVSPSSLLGTTLLLVSLNLLILSGC